MFARLGRTSRRALSAGLMFRHRISYRTDNLRPVYVFAKDVAFGAPMNTPLLALLLTTMFPTPGMRTPRDWVGNNSLTLTNLNTGFQFTCGNFNGFNGFNGFGNNCSNSPGGWLLGAGFEYAFTNN